MHKRYAVNPHILSHTLLWGIQYLIEFRDVSGYIRCVLKADQYEIFLSIQAASIFLLHLLKK